MTSHVTVHMTDHVGDHVTGHMTDLYCCNVTNCNMPSLLEQLPPTQFCYKNMQDAAVRFHGNGAGGHAVDSPSV